MKKLLIIAAVLISVCSLSANPVKGGYLGHRFIVGGEFSYSPFLTSFKDFYTKYNLQYGGQLGVVVGRYTQVNIGYNMYSLGNNQLYIDSFSTGDRVKGSTVSFTMRNFRKKAGGLAPIGKFWDVGFGFSQNKFVAASDNPYVENGSQALLPPDTQMLLLSFAFGRQMVFWDRVVASSGVRFTGPMKFTSGTGNTDYPNFMLDRVGGKDLVSVFFAAGILL